MTWGLVATAGATLVGGMMSADAASSASDAQVQASHEANQLNRDVYNNQVALNDPYRQMGLGAGNRLMYLLGLTPGPSSPLVGGGTVSGSGGGVSTTGGAPQTRDQLRQQLLSQYTTTPSGGATGGGMPTFSGTENGEWSGPGYGGQPATPVVDEVGLNAEIDRIMAQQASQQQSTTPDPSTDPEFGSLMRDFSMSDYQEDPGYQFRLQQGNQALERGAAARGGLLSGRAMKDAMRFNQDQASQEYQNAFNRFQVNRSNKLNPLQSLLGVGQTATGALTGAASSYGSQTGANIVGAGNATASGIVGGANAINGAIGQGTSIYQQNRLMDQIFNRGNGTGNGGGTGYETWRTTGNGYDQ